MPLLPILLAIIGACIGSFLNVLIYRLPRGLDFVRGRSCCPTCGAGIRALHLIPVAGYILLRGKCGSCGGRISPAYPIVELTAAMLFVLAFFRYEGLLQAAAAGLVWAVLLAVALIDAEHMVIPDGLVIALLVLAAGWAVIDFHGFAVTDEGVSVLSRLAGFFAVSAPLLIVTLVKSGAFGGGDIKLIAVCGVILGFRLVLFAFFVAVVFGGLYAVYLKFTVLKKKSAKGVHMPFGQFLASGVFLSMVLGDIIIDWYLGMIF